MLQKDTSFEPTNPLDEIVGQQIGNTLYVVSVSCEGKEPIFKKIGRHICKDENITDGAK